MDLVADLRKCWTKFEETTGVPKSQGKSSTSALVNHNADDA